MLQVDRAKTRHTSSQTKKTKKEEGERERRDEKGEQVGNENEDEWQRKLVLQIV